MFVTYDDSTQLRPDSAQPIEIRRRGPKRSTSHAWIGEQNVCSTISSENVTCNCASVAPSLPSSEWMNSVHVYCGLEIDIIATNPSNICHQRFEYEADGCAASGNTVLIVSSRVGHCDESAVARIEDGNSREDRLAAARTARNLYRDATYYRP